MNDNDTAYLTDSFLNVNLNCQNNPTELESSSPLTPF